LLTEIKYEEAYSSLISMRKQIFIYGGAFILLSSLIGLLLGRRMTGPIRKVATGAGELAKQNFSYRIDVSSHDEIGEMADTFNYLGESLEKYDAQIKKEVSIRTDLSRYITPELVEAIINRKADLKLGGEKKNVAVVFADVVSFTPLTESLPPETVVSILNELFTILTQIIFRNKGMIDKFIGDCVMALYGAVEDDPNAVINAVQTAEEMIRWLEVGNKKWKREHNVELQLAVAIHYGETVIGNIGSEKRMEFTAIGDIVNTTARIEKLAKPNQILITDAVRFQLPDTMIIKSTGRFALKGKSQEIDVYEVVT